MKHFLKILTSLLCVISSQSLYAADIVEYKGVEFTNSGSTHKVVFSFSGPISADKVVTEFINQTVQLYVPGANIAKKSFTEVEDSKLHGLYTYKLGKKGIRARIIYKKPIMAEKLTGKIKISSSGNKLTISIDHDGVGSVVAKNYLPKITAPLKIASKVAPQLPSILFEVDAAANYTAAEIVQKELGSDFSTSSSKKDKVTLTDAEIQSEIDEELAKRGLKVGRKINKGIADSLIVKKTEELDLEESEIPLSLGVIKKKESGSSPLARVLMSLGVLVLLVGGFFIFAKWWGNHQKKSLGDNHIHVLTQHYLGPKKSIAIIRVAGESILIGVTDQNISMLKTLSLIDEEISSEESNNFEGTLNSMAQQEMIDDLPTDKISLNQSAVVATHKVATDDFNYGQIKDIVSSKLKKMRTL